MIDWTKASPRRVKTGIIYRAGVAQPGEFFCVAIRNRAVYDVWFYAQENHTDWHYRD